MRGGGVYFCRTASQASLLYFLSERGFQEPIVGLDRSEGIFEDGASGPSCQSIPLIATKQRSRT